MNTLTKKYILEKWENYFTEIPFPIVVFYSDVLSGAEYVKKPAESSKGYTCIFAQMSKLHRRQSIAFDINNLGCFGSLQTIFGGLYDEDKTVELLVDIEHFKKNREQVVAMYHTNPKANPTGKYLIMKPYDQLTEEDYPEIVIMFTTPDLASAMHCLMSFDDTRVDTMIVPFGSGCEQLLSFAFDESKQTNPRAVLGGMDMAMRGCVKANLQTLSIPHARFIQMIHNMDESFLNTYIWKAIKPRVVKNTICKV